MAVEIPVVVDIEKGFADAAKRVPKAMAPLKDSIEKLTDDLSKWQDKLNKYKIDSSQWKSAAKHIQLISQALEIAQDRLAKYTSNDGSIRRMNAELASLNRRWEEMGSAQKFDKKGNLSAEAKQIWAEYKRITAEIQKSGQSLAQLEAEEQRLIKLAEKRNKLTEDGAKKRQYENAILNSTVQTMRVLQEQERILSERLSRSVIGSAGYKQLETQLQKVRQRMKETAGASDNLAGALNRQTGVIGRLTAQMGMYVSIYSLIRFAKQIRDVTGELEYQRVALGHLIQDEEYGARLFEEIKTRAIESPFRIKDLVTYTKQLAAFRVEQEELFSTMDRLADISAGLGVDMDRLILAYGQVRAASVLRGQELRQFTEAGIPLVDLLAEKFSELNGKAVKTADVFELISKRAVPFSMISEIFEDMTEKGGMFYKMQEEQAKTLTGRWQKLKDAFDIGRQSVGETGTFKFFNDATLAILNAFAKNLQVIPKLIEGASAAWLVYTIATTKSRIATRQAAIEEIREATAKEAQRVANIKGIKHVDAYTNAMIRQKVATNALAKGFWKLWAAIVASPLGAALALIGGIAAALLMFNKRTDEATKNFEELDKLIEDTSKGLKDVSRFDKLIGRYEALASKTELTDKENQKLYQTMSLLQEKFPEVAIGVDAESDALDVQIGKLKELNKAREEELRTRAEQMLDNKRLERDEAQQKIRQLYRERVRKEQTAARLKNEMALNDLYKDNPEWKADTHRINEINKSLAEQESLLTNLDKRIIALNRILHPESAGNTFNAWQRQIRAVRDLTVGDVTSQIFTDDEIEKWETLDAALADIEKRKQKVQKREDELSESIKNQTREVREQIQAELDWARAERLRLQLMEEWFKTSSVFAEDIKENFRNLLATTFDEGNLKQYGQSILNYLAMQTNINPDAKLLARPLVDAAELVKKGWEDAGEGIATVFSSVYDWEDEQGNKHNIMVTPILPDGSILTPDELDEYVQKIIKSGKFEDEKGILLGIDVTADAGERLHQMQEEFYHLMQMKEDLPQQILITEKDLAGLREASDVISLVDSKISAIEKELEAVKSINIENLSEEEIRKTENYKNNLEEIYSALLGLRDKFKVGANFPDIAQDIMENFNDVLSRNVKNAKGVTIPVEFMLSDKELQELYNVGDLFDLIDKKIEGIEKEIEKVNATKIEEGVSQEVIENAELYAINLERVLNLLRQIEGRYRDQYTELAKDVQSRFPNLLESTFKTLDRETYSKKGLFSEKELKGITTIVDLYDSWASKTQAVNKALETNNKKLATTLDLKLKEKILATIDSLEEQKKALKEMGDAYGFVLPEGGGGGGYQQDPWILIYKNRIKFVQDFSKGVKELNQYMSANNALIKEREVMKGRGASLGFDVSKMTGSRQEVMQWYDDTINAITKKIAALGGKTWAGLGVQAILAKDTKSRILKAWQDLLADVFKEKSDFELTNLKDDFETKLKRLSDEIKRSEAARNFYHNILDLTGDEKLAATMSVEVYGGLGNTFQERMQQQLNAVLGSLDASKITDELRDAFANQNFSVIMANLDKIPEAWHKQLKDMADSAQKFSADQIQTWLKELQKDQEFADKRVQLARQTQERIAEINRSNLPDDEKQSLISQYVAREAKEVAKLQYEAFKNSPMYIALFEDLDAASSKMLDNMRTRLIELKGQWSNLDPVQLKEMQKRLDDIDAAIARRNPFKALGESIKAYRKLLASGRTREGDEEAAILAEQNRRTAESNLETAVKDLRIKKDAYEQSVKQNGADSITTGLLKMQYDAQNNIVGARRKEANAAKKAADSAQENADEWTRLSANVQKSIEGLSRFSIATQLVKKNISDIVDLISEMTGSDGLSEAADLLGSMAEAASNAASGLARVLAGDISGAGDLLSAKMSGVQIILQAINMINNIQLREWDTQMESQNKILTRLQRTYDDLGDAIDDAFGNDYIYNYNEMLKNLAAQQEAYEKQMVIQQRKAREASRDEDRKAAADEAENLKKQITGVEKQAKEVTQSMQEFFAGTDLTSAAEAFADAWLDAYREFGSTTDAIKEKMQDMINNLIVKSVMAGAAERILGPWFDKIEAYAKDKTLANRIPELATELLGLTGDINETLTALSNVLQSQGVDVRQTAGRFTGIAHEVAGASEESILALAAGINTQNYYMSYVPMIHTNLEQVLALMGGSPTTPTVAPSAAEEGPAMPSVQEMIYDHLPNIDRNLADIKQMLSDVIKPVGTTASKYVATRM